MHAAVSVIQLRPTVTRSAHAVFFLLLSRTGIVLHFQTGWMCCLLSLFFPIDSLHISDFFFFWGSGWVWVWLESTVEPAEAEQLEWLYYWCWSSWSCRRWHKKLTTCWEIRLSAATTWFLTGGTYSLIESSCFPRLLTTQVVLCRKGSDTHTDVSEIFHIFHNMHINLMFEVCFSVWLVET